VKSAKVVLGRVLIKHGVQHVRSSPQKLTFYAAICMSALGQLQTNGAGNQNSYRLWIERADVSSEGDHVVLRELLDSLFHEGACASRSAAALE
jgi:hypothetical protein